MVHTGNHQACIDDVRNIWEIFEPHVNRLSFPIFLAVQPFSYNSVWFAGIYVRGGGITKLFLVRVIMGLARNIVGGVKFTFTMTGISVRVVEWH